MIGAALLAAASLALPPAASEERPNVIVLMTDDQTAESLRAMPAVRSELVGAGTSFDRSFVSNPLCCPSRATFLTGQYSHNHGVLDNDPPDGGYFRLGKREWLPVWLQRAGYHTVHIGKFLNRYGVRSPTEVPPGWDEWYASVDPSTYRYNGYTLNENGGLNVYERYSTDEYAARAVSVVERMGETRTPFFLSVAFLAPHTGAPADPDDPPNLATPSPAARHANRFAGAGPPGGPALTETDLSDKPGFIRTRPPIGPERRAAIAESYRQGLESLLAVDEGVAAIIAALRAEGELDDTLIVFTSDNGYFYGEHGIQNGKVLAYEPSIRVPLVLRGPGVPAGARRRQLVTNADLAPTILAAAGGVPGKVQDGRSLFPLLDDPGLEWGRDLLVEGAAGLNQPAYDALRTYRYTFVEYTTGERELYDLERDPFQLQSLHADPAHAKVQEELARRVARLRDCAGTACWARPPVRLSVRAGGRGCRARVTLVAGAERSGLAIEQVGFRSARRVTDRRAPFRARVEGGRLRARVRTLDGQVVTLDRALPAECR